MSATRFLKIYEGFPGNNCWDKGLYVLYKCLLRLLISRHVLYKNGNRYHKRSNADFNETSIRRYKKLVCITGFGHSGSGALIDLLSEYDNTTVTGWVDGANGSLRAKTGEDIEFDLLRQYGGLFSLEDVLTHGRLYDYDSTVKTFLSLAAHHYTSNGVVFGERFRRLTMSFLENILDYSLESSDGYDYCPHIRGVGEDGVKLFLGEDASMPIFHLKKLREKEYRSIAREYVQGVIDGIPAAGTLVLDQIVSDTTADIEKYREYLGDFKLIAVYRDPRDVYATAHKSHVRWIPKSANAFIHWYLDSNKLERYMSLEDKDFRLLRFEDLVCDYERTTMLVEDFLCIPRGAHRNIRKAFDPDISKKNVGLWKSFPELSGDMEIIQGELSKYCYEI